MLFVAGAHGQDMPPYPQIDQPRIMREIASLQLQLSNALDYINTLQARIRELQAENAKLKEK